MAKKTKSSTPVALSLVDPKQKKTSQNKNKKLCIPDSMQVSELKDKKLEQEVESDDENEEIYVENEDNNVEVVDSKSAQKNTKKKSEKKQKKSNNTKQKPNQKKNKNDDDDSEYSGNQLKSDESSTDSDVSSVKESESDCGEEEEFKLSEILGKGKPKKQSKPAQKEKGEEGEQKGNNKPKKGGDKKSGKDSKTLNSYKELIAYIEKNCSPRKKAKRDEKGKLFRNVMNFGGRMYDQVVMSRPGEYFGLGVELLGDIKPQITEMRMMNALRIIDDNNEDIPAAIKQLYIEQEIQKYGVNILFFVIKEWLKSLNLPSCVQLDQYDLSEYENNSELDYLMEYINKDTHSTLPCQIKIIQIGQSKKGNTVVPEDWMDRVFNGSHEMHREMDKLDWRRGKPPITYCCTYGSMNHVDKQTWKTLKELKGMKLPKVEVFCRIYAERLKKKGKMEVEGEVMKDEEFILKSECYEIKDDKDLNEKLKLVNEEKESLLLGDFKQCHILVSCDKDSIFRDNSSYEKSDNTGMLVSRIQKAIRRGRKSPKTLIDTITALAECPPYNLPDQQFVRVSSNRQLLWRIFISCVEDSRLYMLQKDESSLLSLQTIVLLSLVCRLDSDIQLKEQIINKLTLTALHIQKADEQNSHFEWRRGDHKADPNLKVFSTGVSGVDEVQNSLKLGLRFSPMMAGDQKMLRMTLNYLYSNMFEKSDSNPKQKKGPITQEKVSLQKLKSIKLDYLTNITKDITEFLQNSHYGVERLVMLSSVDMHCIPGIILQLQSALPFYPSHEFSTKKVSSFIWEYSSSFNLRYSQPRTDMTVNQKLALHALREIQDSHLNLKTALLNRIRLMSYVKPNSEISYKPGKQADKLVSRIAFLSIFGRRQRVKTGQGDKTVDLILCGNAQMASKVKRLSAANQMKYLEDDERFQIECNFFQDFSLKPLEVTVPNPPVGFDWNFSSKKIKISGKIISSNKEEKTNEYKFFINKSIKVNPFDGASLLVPLEIPIEENCDEYWKSLLRQAFYHPGYQFTMEQLYEIEKAEQEKYKLKQIEKTESEGKKSSQNNKMVAEEEAQELESEEEIQDKKKKQMKTKQDQKEKKHDAKKKDKMVEEEIQEKQSNDKKELNQDKRRLMKPYELLHYLKGISLERKVTNDLRVFNIRDLIEENKTLKESVIWKHLLVKLHSDENEIVIGPVDRSGSKLQHSISYVYEGALQRFFLILSALYPRVILVSDANFKFKVDRRVNEYVHMIELICHYANSSSQNDQERSEQDLQVDSEQDNSAILPEELRDDQSTKIIDTFVVDAQGNRKSSRNKKETNRAKAYKEMSDDEIDIIDEEDQEQEEEKPLSKTDKNKKTQQKKKEPEQKEENHKNKKKKQNQQSDSEDYEVGEQGEEAESENDDEKQPKNSDSDMESEIDDKLENKKNKQAQIQLNKYADNKKVYKIGDVEIITKLWEHQQSTVDRISDGFINWGKKGFGDASCVGAGKTLTALSVIERIYQHSKTLESEGKGVEGKAFKGFLVLIPAKQLFDTWITEIKKHSRGFQLILQNSDGSLHPPVQDIKPYHIVVTTLGRIRDHPIYYSWQLVVIDECLSVERREALQTEEAWRQVMISHYGVLMMSATFFRSRFDQLFFMLKMLRSGLPETKDYLDSILNESMVCFIGDNGRKWTTNITRFDLTEELRRGYETIQRIQNQSSEAKYNLLSDFLYKNYSIVNDLKKHVKQLESEGCKILIFLRSKNEADQIASKVKNVTRFPDLSGDHVAISYAEGTYGLNTLIKYNTLLTRPPEPDKLPQMKGRLDRPGQLSDQLRLEYMLVGNTIEEAWLLRLEIAKKFLSDYIMPLAQFYEAAVNYKSE